jgi:hypothetical protein
MMRAKGNSLTLREDEKSFYNSLFLILDVDGTGVLRRPQFIPLLQRTGLDAEVRILLACSRAKSHRSYRYLMQH